MNCSGVIFDRLKLILNNAVLRQFWLFLLFFASLFLCFTDIFDFCLPFVSIDSSVRSFFAPLFLNELFLVFIDSVELRVLVDDDDGFGNAGVTDEEHGSSGKSIGNVPSLVNMT